MIRFAAVAAVGLGTNYLAYVHMFASHSQYAAIAFIAFATIEREKRLSRGDAKARRWKRAMLAGFCTSACVAFEYQSLFLTVILSALRGDRVLAAHAARSPSRSAACSTCRP